jgi:hypothetical protein
MWPKKAIQDLREVDTLIAEPWIKTLIPATTAP